MSSAYLPPKRPPAELKPRPQRFVLTRLSLYRPLPAPVALAVLAVLSVLVSMGSSKPYEPSRTMWLSEGRVEVCVVVGAEGVLPILW